MSILERIRKRLVERPLISRITEGARLQAVVSPEQFVRYYFWEDNPTYGRRQLGKVDGYSTIEELEEDCKFYIEHNKEKGIPCWAMKSTFYKRYV